MRPCLSQFSKREPNFFEQRCKILLEHKGFSMSTATHTFCTRNFHLVGHRGDEQPDDGGGYWKYLSHLIQDMTLMLKSCPIQISFILIYFFLPEMFGGFAN